MVANPPAPFGVAVHLPYAGVDPDADCADECRLTEVGSEPRPEVVVDVGPPVEGPCVERQPMSYGIEEANEQGDSDHDQDEEQATYPLARLATFGFRSAARLAVGYGLGRRGRGVLGSSRRIRGHIAKPTRKLVSRGGIRREERDRGETRTRQPHGWGWVVARLTPPPRSRSGLGDFPYWSCRGFDASLRVVQVDHGFGRDPSRSTGLHDRHTPLAVTAWPAVGPWIAAGSGCGLHRRAVVTR